MSTFVDWAEEELREKLRYSKIHYEKAWETPDPEALSYLTELWGFSPSNTLFLYDQIVWASYCRAVLVSEGVGAIFKDHIEKWLNSEKGKECVERYREDEILVMLEEAFDFTEFEASISWDIAVLDVATMLNLPSVIILTFESDEERGLFSVFGDIAKGLNDFIDTVITALQNPYIQIAIIILVMYAVTYPAIASAYESTALTYMDTYAVDLTTMDIIKLGVDTFVETISQTWSEFLTFIHFDTILGIHEIAYIVSEDYRAIMIDVYASISEVSDALGFGPYFLTLAYRNMRTIVLDASTTLGMSYDLAEIQWLNQSMEYLNTFAARAYRYKDNPSELFFDMEQLVDRPNMDAKAGLMTTILQGINDVSKGLTSAVIQTMTLRDDLDRFVSELPEEIRVKVEEYTDPIIAKVDGFKATYYDPYKAEIDGIIGVLNERMATANTTVDGLIDRLRKPGDYLLEIDSLDDTDRLDQERKIGELSTRQYRRDVDEFARGGEPIDAELRKVREALEHVSLIPLEFPEEILAPSRPAGEKAIPRESWFVGDY